MGATSPHWRPRRVLIGYDGTEGGRDAIALRDLADRRVETRTYVANSPAHVLSDLAEQEGHDLVAIGPCYPGAVGRIVLGSVGTGLMHGACAPVAVATRGYHKLHRREIKEVAVAWDGSPEAREAVLLAEALARRESARLRLITVDVRETTLPGLVGWEPPVPKTPAEVLEEGVDLVSPHLEVVGKLLNGSSIPAAIAEECRVGVDLVVVGSRGYGALGRVLVGSVGTGLMHRSPCPVIAVPRPCTPLGEQSFRAEESVATR